jgi:ribonuclease-3
MHEVVAAGGSAATSAHLTNERLEFLGDAVLGVIAAEYLYAADPRADEGALTRRRVALIRAETLVAWAREIDLGGYLYLASGERPSGGSRDRMLAGAFEALVGAIFLDGGFAAAGRFLRRFLVRDAPAIIAEADAAANPKGRLQELLQERYRASPVYSTAATAGPDHARTFTIDVALGDRHLGRGSGASKREAEQAAAAAALAGLDA